MTGIHDMKTRSCTCLKAKPQVSEIEKWDGEDGRRGARLHKVTFTLDFLRFELVQ